jgi:hypothetical protein
MKKMYHLEREIELNAIYKIRKASASVTCNEKPVTINVATSIILHDNFRKRIQKKVLWAVSAYGRETKKNQKIVLKIKKMDDMRYTLQPPDGEKGIPHPQSPINTCS